MKTTPVFDMVRQVIADAREKVASQGDRAPGEKVAEKTKTASPKPAPTGGIDLVANAEKVASACFYLADNIHLVVDQRTPQEKLAEYVAIQEALNKQAFEVGNNSPPEPSLNTDTGNKGSHQTTKAPGESQSPMKPTTDTSGTGVGGPSTSMHAEPATTGGGPILQGGDSGEAAGEKPSMTITPNEKPNPTQAGNALETNLTDPPGGTTPWPDDGPAKQAFARKVAGLVAVGAIRKEAAAVLIKNGPAAMQKQAALKKAAALAKTSGAPPGIASALLKKFAEDALNPAQISGGTTPELQSAAGIPSALSQGAEAGQNTPNTRGDTAGRDLVASNEAAINATKKDAKHSKTQSGMAPYVDEPAMSAAHDNVLSKALDNTSSAGVKIAADSARAMLERWSNQSPANKEKLSQALKKVADAEMGYGGGAPAQAAQAAGAAAAPPAAAPPMGGGGGGGPMPGSAMGMNKLQAADAAEAPPISDQALQAAAEGVTPEELAEAMAMIEQAGGGPAAGMTDAPASPQAGGEQPPVA